ncbi:MAG TPA: exopolysaccharide biosynthesis polyprenyl glycosylphosphotransferase [Baekduia sp.]|nr:exopolysaccharide biosynthesis polyprenyl glycosylphosphotransferase [Baekduia sp.]
MRRLLLGADVVGLAVATLVAGAIALAGASLPAALLQIALTVAAIAATGLYGRDEVQIDRQTADDLPSLVQAITSAAFAQIALGVLAGGPQSAVSGAVATCLVMLATVPCARAVARAAARRHPAYQQVTLVLGAGEVGQLIARKLKSHPEYGLRFAGFVDADPRDLESDVDAPVYGGGVEEIERLVDLLHVDRVIVAFSADQHHVTLEALDALRRRGVRVDLVPRLFEAVGPRFAVSHLEGMPLLTLRPREPARVSLVAKRALDVAGAGLALVAAAPLFAAIALLVRLDSSGPVLYRGRRVGADGQVFDQLKFRTMRQEWCTPHGADHRFQRYLSDMGLADEFARTQKLRQDPRVTRVGRILRRTSLDELPQLWNVVRGDLALVGPRPITEAERMSRYFDARRDRALVGYWDCPGLRPGLTGWWQINGRSSMSFEERIRLDTAYLTSWSLLLDLHILAKTLRTLVSTDGAY